MESLGVDLPPPVLVVEDDPVTAMVLTRYLQSAGYPVQHAEDGIVALTCHRRTPFRIVVSDWNMPTMDGTSLCREFRSLAGSYVYFILCSARTERADRTEAFAAGVDDFLSKPIDQTELSSRLTVARRILASEDRLERQRRQLEENSRLLVQSNDEFRALSRKYSELFHGLPMACFQYDTNGLIQEWNREAEVAFGIPKEQAAEFPVWEVLRGAHFAAWSEIRARGFIAGVDDQTFDWSLDRKDGQTRHFAANIICMRDRSNQTSGVLCASIDITERKRTEVQLGEYAAQVESQRMSLETMNRQLQTLAITDELTGLANRRHFRRELAAALTVRETRSLALLLLDLDHFKRVNDLRGHLAGDDVLRQFAELLRKTALEGELISRYGGEEFAVLIAGADAEAAWQAGERFRQAVERHDWDGLDITISVGVAASRSGVATEDDLVGRADAALYVAKDTGRNRVCSADPPQATMALA